mgnify:CR=1 FL=1
MNRKLHIIYRISNNSYAKDKLWAENNKEICLMNMFMTFGIHDDVDITIIKDNVTDPHTVEFINRMVQIYNTTYNKQVTLLDTSLGNAQSFWYAYEYALSNFTDLNDVVYLLEDDYFHLMGSYHSLMSGIERSDYVSLYDHPDKYKNRSDGGDNPFIEYGGEVTRVILTATDHWKLTNSTTMTFAAKIKTLKADQDVWKRHTSNGNHPNDFGAFIELRGIGRSVITPIPGMSTHTELNYLTPLISYQLADSLETYYLSTIEYVSEKLILNCRDYIRNVIIKNATN